jgi:hypothetical protein
LDASQGKGVSHIDALTMAQFLLFNISDIQSQKWLTDWHSPPAGGFLLP